MWKSEDQKQGFLSYINAKFAYMDRYKRYLEWRKDVAWKRAIERGEKKRGKN